MAAPKKFTSTIFCGNCRNVGEYEFRRGTVIHPEEQRVEYERRNTAPGDYAHVLWIHGTRYSGGKAVPCKFCGVTTDLTIRERNGDAPYTDLSSVKSALITAASAPTKCTITEGCVRGARHHEVCLTDTEVPY